MTQEEKCRVDERAKARNDDKWRDVKKFIEWLSITDFFIWAIWNWDITVCFKKLFDKIMIIK